jgi:type II secretory pathway pseudopilin PulG
MTRNRIGILVGTVLMGITFGLASTGWSAPRERHPEIRAAQRDLASAKGHLQAAARDFGGHRAKAVALIEQAQDELRKAVDFDKH